MRIIESRTPTRLVAGIDSTAAAVMRFAGGVRPVALVDAVFDAAALRLPREARIIPLATGPGGTGLDLDDLQRLSESAVGATAIIAVGGGSTIDAAKVMRVLLTAPAVVDTARRFIARSGFYHLPELSAPHGQHVPLLAVPTTFGTAAEVSPVACVRTASGRRLLSGSRLRADDAALDPLHTRTLPRTQQMEGLLEVVLRVIGAAAGSPRDAAADHDARSIVHGITTLAETLRRAPLHDEQRLFAAQLSAATQRTWALAGRQTYAAKHWYLANELSWVTGARKIPATAAVLPTLWGRIADGDVSWGSRERLAEAWGWVREALPDLPEAAGDGIRALLGRWGVMPMPAPTSDDLDDTVERILMSWAAPYPALGRIERSALRGILTESFASTRAPSIRSGRG